MADFELIPQSWFSWNFDVMQGGASVAKIASASLIKEQATLTIHGATYKAFRESLLGGPFLLQENDQTIARAEKPSVLMNMFSLEYAGHAYTLRKESFIGRTFVLMSEDQQVGIVKPEGLLTRKATVSLPNELPLPVQVFAIWLVLLIWKRENSAAAHST